MMVRHTERCICAQHSTARHGTARHGGSGKAVYQGVGVLLPCALGAAEEDAVRPRRHPLLLAAVVRQRVRVVLVELVGGLEIDGRLVQTVEDATRRHLIFQLILQSPTATHHP